MRKWPRRGEEIDLDRCVKGLVFVENREVVAGEMSFVFYPTRANATRIGMLLLSIPGLEIHSIDREFPESVPHMDAPVTMTLRFPLSYAHHLLSAINPLEYAYATKMEEITDKIPLTSEPRAEEAAKRALADCLTKYPAEETCQYLCTHGHVDFSCVLRGTQLKHCIKCDSYVALVSNQTPGPLISRFFYKQKRAYELMDLMPERTPQE